MKIAVIGAGGVGGYFGARLAAVGHDVTFVARGKHLAAMRRDGLAVTSPAREFTVSPVRATQDTRQVGQVDVVLVGVKTWQLPQVLANLPPLLGGHTAVLTLQNGVEAPEQVAKVVGDEAVLPGTAKIIARLEAPGRVRHDGGPGSLTFAEWDNRPTPRVQQLRTALAESGVPAFVPDDIWAELWAKFLFAVPLGGLGSVTGATFGMLRDRPGTRRLLMEAMIEIRRLAQAMGVALPAGIVADTMAFLDRQPAAGTSSLQRDILSGRPSELDAWTGAVVRLGAQSGTATPVNQFIYEVLSLREEVHAMAGQADGSSNFDRR